MLNLNSAHPKQSEDLSGLAAILYHANYLDNESIKTAMQKAKEQSISFICYLVRANILSSETILNCCVKKFNLPVFELKNYNFEWLHNSVINSEIICRYHVIPLKMEKIFLQLGISDPTNYAAISAINFHTGLAIHPVLISESELDAFINTHCRPKVLYAQLKTTLSKIVTVEEQPEQLDNNESHSITVDEPVIEFVDKLIFDAIEKQISDIHIEPYEHSCRFRFRCDGILYEAAVIPLHLAMRVITRLKVMANLNIAERRLPQDGHIKTNNAYKIDIRINSCPTLYGEKIVLRLLDTKKINLDISTLGFNAEQQELFLRRISQPQGLILVTGPTGSGKTISLYSALNYLNRIEKNISTAEDPVEIELSGINQVTINPRIGLDFPAALRTLLRQDPDIIMIGEIRDKETAYIAMQAAETGHLVLSTLHTNSAIETIVRLRSIGIATYQLLSAISLIVAQRLVRKLCRVCNQNKIISTNPTGNLTYNNQCQYCHYGYQGRIGIFECLAITEDIVQLILENTPMLKISAHLKKTGWTSLWDSGLEKIKAGMTNYAELTRILNNTDENSYFQLSQESM